MLAGLRVVPRVIWPCVALHDHTSQWRVDSFILKLITRFRVSEYSRLVLLGIVMVKAKSCWALLGIQVVRRVGVVGANMARFGYLSSELVRLGFAWQSKSS